MRRTRAPFNGSANAVMFDFDSAIIIVRIARWALIVSGESTWNLPQLYQMYAQL